MTILQILQSTHMCIPTISNIYGRIGETKN